MREAPRHSESIAARFGTDANGCLTIGGLSLSRLAQRMEQTPFYAYSRALITERVSELRSALPREIALSYAVKANPMPAVLQHLATLVDGFDVASAAEMKVALDTPMEPGRISFAGPGKADRELVQAIAAGIVINIESENEMRRVAEIGTRLGIRPKVAVRVNPGFEVKASGMQMGGGPKAFGIDAERVPDMLHRVPSLNLELEGLHIFSSSQNLNAASLIDVQSSTIDLAIELARSAPGRLRTVNIGGGFGIPYFPGDEPLDLQKVSDALDGGYRRISRTIPGVRVVLELGRYLVGEAGIYVCRVQDRKVSRGKLYLVTDGGLHHHLSASGNFGQVVRRNFPIAVGNRMTAETRETADIVGCLCTPIDMLGRTVSVAAAEVGDLIVIFQSGAYGASASPTNFLSHPPPVEVLV